MMMMMMVLSPVQLRQSESKENSAGERVRIWTLQNLEMAYFCFKFSKSTVTTWIAAANSWVRLFDCIRISRTKAVHLDRQNSFAPTWSFACRYPSPQSQLISQQFCLWFWELLAALQCQNVSVSFRPIPRCDNDVKEHLQWANVNQIFHLIARSIAGWCCWVCRGLQECLWESTCRCGLSF